MSERVIARRSDGSFIVEKGGFPYHVVAGDPLFDRKAAEAASAPMEAPYVAPDPGPAVLSRVQWGTFLDMTGFRAVADAVLAGLPRGTTAEITQWALLKNVIAESAYYRLETALLLVERAAILAPKAVLPTESEIRAAWDVAAALSVDDLMADGG